MIQPNNQFTIEVDASLDCLAARPVLQWLNIQHTGQPTMPLEQKCSKIHQDATHNLLRVRKVKLTFEIDKHGDWQLINILPPR